VSGGATGAHRHEKYPVKPFHACKDSHFPKKIITFAAET
jgi:hypothetical protein